MTLEIELETTTRKKLQAFPEGKEESLIILGDLEAKLILYKQMYMQDYRLAGVLGLYKDSPSTVTDLLRDDIVDMYRITYLTDIKIGKIYTKEQKSMTKLIPKQKLTDGQGGCDRMWITEYSKEFIPHTVKTLVQGSGKFVFDEDIREKIQQYKQELDEFGDKEGMTLPLFIKKPKEAAQLAETGRKLVDQMVSQIELARQRVKQGLYSPEERLVFYK